MKCPDCETDLSDSRYASGTWTHDKDACIAALKAKSSPRLSLVECQAIILVDAFCYSAGSDGIDDGEAAAAFAALVKEARAQWKAAGNADLAPWVKTCGVTTGEKQ